MAPTAKTHTVTDLPPNVSKYIDVQEKDASSPKWSDHWIWTGVYHSDGMPLIGSKTAHSVIYRYLNPEIAKLDGRILRQCGDKRCVNPAHMRYPMHEGPLKLSKLDPAVRKAWLGRPSGSSVTIAQIEKEHEESTPALVKVLQRIAEALERMETTHLKT